MDVIFIFSPGNTFTFSDVTRNILFYRHAGLSSQDDAITFSVSDGISMATTVVQVMVLGAGDDGPVLDPAATLSLEVGENSSTVISRSHLAYTVSETPLFNHLFYTSLGWSTAWLYTELHVDGCNHVLSLAGQGVPR